jgi:hypothetical protein
MIYEMMMGKQDNLVWKELYMNCWKVYFSIMYWILEWPHNIILNLDSLCEFIG